MTALMLAWSILFAVEEASSGILDSPVAVAAVTATATVMVAAIPVITRLTKLDHDNTEQHRANDENAAIRMQQKEARDEARHDLLVKSIDSLSSDVRGHLSWHAHQAAPTVQITTERATATVEEKKPDAD